jgi:hypothetical protein
MTQIELSLTTTGLWIATIAQDLRRREVSALVLAPLVVSSLIGHSWPWWVIAGLVLLWPWRGHALILVPVAVGLGAFTNEPAVMVALAGGVTGWALGWWGGADGIALLALALRGGSWGLVAGMLTLVVVGVTLMIARRRSLWGILGALPGFLAFQTTDGEIPAGSEMPAAAALGVAGVLMEVTVLWQMFG